MKASSIENRGYWLCIDNAGYECIGNSSEEAVKIAERYMARRLIAEQVIAEIAAARAKARVVVIDGVEAYAEFQTEFDTDGAESRARCVKRWITSNRDEHEFVAMHSAITGYSVDQPVFARAASAEEAVAKARKIADERADTLAKAKKEKKKTDYRHCADQKNKKIGQSKFDTHTSPAASAIRARFACSKKSKTPRFSSTIVITSDSR